MFGTISFFTGHCSWGALQVFGAFMVWQKGEGVGGANELGNKLTNE